jgi:hypothetical protein
MEGSHMMKNTASKAGFKPLNFGSKVHSLTSSTNAAGNHFRNLEFNQGPSQDSDTGVISTCLESIAQNFFFLCNRQ